MNRQTINKLLIFLGVIVYIYFGYLLLKKSFGGIQSRRVSIPKNSTLIVNFGKESGGIYSILRKSSLIKLEEGLKKAGNDPKISRIILRIKLTYPEGWANIREIREILLKIRKKKPVIAYIENGDDRIYYLATSGDSIIMPPLGILLVDGLSLRVDYYKGLFEKLGIKWEVIREGKYKSAVEPYIQSSPSPEAKKMLGDILFRVYNVYKNDVAKSRGITKKTFQKMIDDGPYLTARLALVSKLIDKISYETEAIPTKDTISFSRYVSSKNVLGFGIKKIGFLHLKGEILAEGTGTNWKKIVPEDVIKILNKYRKDPFVKAVVIRVDSPGGSAYGADLIYNAIKRLNAEKPVVITTGDYAASGGYYISAPAKYIFAQPNTITGSIGVFALKPNVKNLYEKIGMHQTVIKEGKNADFIEGIDSMSTAQKKIFQRGINSVYDEFLRKVSVSRKISIDSVRNIAEGRVWTGQEAKEIGLIDGIGGISDAIDKARELAGIGKKEPVKIELKTPPLFRWKTLFSPWNVEVSPISLLSYKLIIK